MIRARPEGRAQLGGNDYGWLVDAAREPRSLAALPPVSVVIPVYDRRAMLARTLAALTHQTLPRDRFQIVIADDGSRDGVEEVVDRWRATFDLVHVRQEDRGFRLAEVRNLGIRAARHQAIVQLDCDCMPVPGLLEGYARFLACSDRAVLLGRRRYVDAEGLDEAAILADPRAFLSLPDVPGRSEWREPVYAESDALRRHLRPHRHLVGCNVAFARRSFDEVGGYCEEFRAWGREDGEFGYRLENAGHYFVPLPEALVLHQEPPEGPAAADARRQEGMRETDRLQQQKVPYFRRPEGSGGWEVPLLTVLAVGGDPRDLERQTLRDLERQTLRDLERQTLRDLEIVACGPGAEHAAIARSRSPYVARVPGGTVLAPGDLARLLSRLDPAPEGALARGDDAGALRKVWDTAGPAELAAWLDEHVLLFRKRHWSRAGWLAGAQPALLHLPRTTELLVSD